MVKQKSDPPSAPVLHTHPHAHEGGLIHSHPHLHDHPPTVLDPSGEPPALEIDDLHFSYPDGTEALRGIGLRVSPLERVAIVGPNGAGKSSLLLHLNGTHPAQRGSVRVHGSIVDRTTVRRIRASVGLVFQDPDDQLFSPTVLDDVAFGPLHMGLPEPEIHRRVEEALSAVGMRGHEHRLPHRLSLGQRKRIAMATVLSMRPSVLAFDEPTAGLDPRGRRELIELMGDLAQTLIVSTHDMRLVAEVFPRVVVMDDGLIVADGPADRILADDALLLKHGLERP